MSLQSVNRDLAGHLGSCLEPLGFTVDDASRIAGAYKGTVEGRQVRVSCIVRSRNRFLTPGISRRVFDGFAFEISVETSIQTRLAVGHAPRGSDDNIVVQLVIKALTRWRGMQTIESPHSDLDGLNVWAFDPEWAHRCLAAETVRATLRNVHVYGDAWTQQEARYSSWSFGPGSMRLLMSPPLESITPEAVTSWLSDAVRLVQLAEDEPTERIAQKSRVEKTLEDNPNAVVPLALLVVLGVPFVLLFALAVFFIVGWSLFGEAVMIVPIIFMFFFMPYAMFLVFRDWSRQARDKLRSPK